MLKNQILDHVLNNSASCGYRTGIKMSSGPFCCRLLGLLFGLLCGRENLIALGVIFPSKINVCRLEPIVSEFYHDILARLAVYVSSGILLLFFL